VEQRLFPRRHFPEIKAYVKRANKFLPVSKFSGPWPVKNISRCGVCLVCQKPVEIGETLIVKIIIPGQTHMLLKGHVIWCSNGSDTYQYDAGVRFFPFGTLKNHNPISALEYLRSLSENSA